MKNPFRKCIFDHVQIHLPRKVVNYTRSHKTYNCHFFFISYSQECHTTYTTDFEAAQEEECEENFEKNCYIEYKKVAVDETVEMCHTPLVKDCNVPGK